MQPKSCPALTPWYSQHLQLFWHDMIELSCKFPSCSSFPTLSKHPKHNHSTCSCVFTMPDRCTTCMGPAAALESMHFAPNHAAHCQHDLPPCSEHNFADLGSITKPKTAMTSLCAGLQPPITYFPFGAFCAPLRPLDELKAFLQNAIA